MNEPDSRKIITKLITARTAFVVSRFNNPVYATYTPELKSSIIETQNKIRSLESIFSNISQCLDILSNTFSRIRNEI